MAGQPTSPPDHPAAMAAHQTARDSYGRLLALVAARTRDICAAEDALSEAFLAALETWPTQGVPRNPEAWILVAARRQLVDTQRQHSTRQRLLLPVFDSLLADTDTFRGMRPPVPYSLPAPLPETEDPPPFPDDRLRLLFICAHPAVDSTVHTPLMLQAVLGLDTARIASAFLVSPSTMAQRLLRAKTRIRDTGLSFDLPRDADLVGRLEPVLQAIYACYHAGWDSNSPGEVPASDLSTEALSLARILAGHLPDQPEPQSLLALLLYCDSRRTSRGGWEDYIPLDQQNQDLWDHAMVQEAENLLRQAAGLLAPNLLPGRFQIEASIQSAHMARLRQGAETWPVILGFYALLAHTAPSLGATVAQAAAHCSAGQPGQALLILQAMDPSHLAAYQPWWIVQAHALRALGQSEEARQAATHALGLTAHPGLRRWIGREFGLI